MPYNRSCIESGAVTLAAEFIAAATARHRVRHNTAYPAGYTGTNVRGAGSAESLYSFTVPATDTYHFDLGPHPPG